MPGKGPCAERGLQAGAGGGVLCALFFKIVVFHFLTMTVSHSEEIMPSSHPSLLSEQFVQKAMFALIFLALISQETLYPFKGLIS